MDIESTDIDQSADDLRGDIEAVIEDVDATEEAQTEEQGEEQTEETTEEVESTDETEEVAETEEAAPQGIEAPVHWAQEDREMFAGQTPEAQKWLLDRHKAMEGDYTRNMQARAEFDKTYQPIEQMLQPHMENLRAAGVNQTQYLGNLMQADKMLNDNPMQGIQQVAQMYGIDLNNLTAADESFVDPEVASLKQELSTIRNHLTAQEQTAQEANMNSATQKIEQFAAEKAEGGELAHPYFDRVFDDLVNMAHAERNAGREADLSVIYEKAIWANPEIRNEILSGQQKAEQSKALEAAKAKAKKAATASASIKGGSGVAPSSDLTLREELAAQMNG